jgi:broad specificity phosphatase PhoE
VTAALGDVADGLGKGQTAVVVSSGGAIAAISAALLSVPAEALVAFNHVSVNTAITKLVVGRSGTTLISSNEHAHLDEADGSLISYR